MTQRPVEDTRVHFWTFSPVSVKVKFFNKKWKYHVYFVLCIKFYNSDPLKRRISKIKRFRDNRHYKCFEQLSIQKKTKFFNFKFQVFFWLNKIDEQWRNIWEKSQSLVKIRKGFLTKVIFGWWQNPNPAHPRLNHTAQTVSCFVTVFQKV